MNLPKIYSAFLNVTNACNLACRYCFVEQHPNYMTFDVAKNAVDFLQKNAAECGATPSITFFGGEPMICWESVVKPIISYIRREYGNNYSMSMTTNGTLLNEDILKFLSDNGVSIMVSIDGDKKTQDFNRPFHSGAGSFNRIEPILKKYLAYNPNATFRSTLIPETCENIFDNAMFAEKLGFTNFFIIPNVFQDWSNADREKAETAFHKYTEHFIASYLNDRTPISCTPIENGLRDIVSINNAIESRICQGCNTAYQKCGLGSSTFASVDYAGNVYACQEMCSCKGDSDPFYIGNIYSGIDDSMRLKLIGTFDPKSRAGSDCEHCKLNRICDSGCVANNYMWGGSVNSVSDVYCWWMQFILNEAIYVMNTLGNAGCLKFRDYWNRVQESGARKCPNMLSH